MTKIGRNAPCPCGSGKKYKKCCLRKDEEQSLLDKQIDEIDELFEDDEESHFTWDRNPLDEEIDTIRVLSGDETDEFEQDKMIHPSFPQIIENVPEISDEEEALIHSWWDAYVNLDTFNEIKKHIENFMLSYPDLVVNLDLHDEPLFELGLASLQDQKVDEYINFLIMFRQKHLPSYLLSFGFFDKEIITYLVSVDRIDQVPSYLNLFKQYPCSDPDNLFDVIDFLRATGCQRIVIDLVNEVYKNICSSPEIMNGEAILDTVIFTCYIPYLDRVLDDDDCKNIVEDVKKIEYALIDRFYDPLFYKNLFTVIQGPADKWSFDGCRTRKDVIQHYELISFNFMGFLHREKGLKWVQADYYRENLFDYLCQVIPPGIKPKQLFLFTRTLIESTLMKNSMTFLMKDYKKMMCSYVALNWFAEYLDMCQSITTEMKNNIQTWCRELHETCKIDALKTSLESHAFQQFPR